MRRVFEDIEVHEWSEESVAAVATGCDIAVIPLPLDRPLEAGKPENKLVSFWRMGLPTITSSTPAYTRTRRPPARTSTCADEGAWVDALLRLIDDDDARANAGTDGRNFAESHYDDEALASAWDRMFESL